MNALWARLRHCFDLLTQGLKRQALLEQRIREIENRQRARGQG
jgi:hypothetical protein